MVPYKFQSSENLHQIVKLYRTSQLQKFFKINYNLVLMAKICFSWCRRSIDLIHTS